MRSFLKRHGGTLSGIALLGGLVLGGCTSTTETGYEPKRLGMNDAQLKGLYAPAFTPESREAETSGPTPVHLGR